MKLGELRWLWWMQSYTLATHITGQQIMLPLLFCAFHGPGRIALPSAKTPQSGLLGSKGNAIARNSKNIDWKTTFLIKETPGLWFWKPYSTNFPNQPDVLAFLSDVPWGSTKGFVCRVRETRSATAQSQISILIPEYGWYVLRPNVSSCCSQGPGRTSLSEGAVPSST